MEKYSELVIKDIAELKSLVAEARETLRTARFDRSTKEVKNNRMQRATRRQLARLLTAIASKEMEV